jgi:hypothetical protein
MDDALREFGLALKKLKEVYADEYSCNPNYIEVNINDNYVTLTDSQETGGYVYCCREYIG